MSRITMLSLSLLLAIGCSSPAKVGSNSTLRPIHRIIPYNVHIRRPAVLGSDPAVGPGGPDYRTDPLPNERFDCEPFDDLLKGIQVGKLRQCLETLKTEVTVLYRLKRDPAPYLEIDDVEGVPACLSESMPRIPLPREIFFQSNEEGILGCYAARLDIEADELLWVKVPKARTALKLKFSSKSIGPTQEEFTLQFLAWVIAPFQDPQGRLPSRVVPDVLCKRCMGEANMMKEGSQPILLWP